MTVRYITDPDDFCRACRGKGGTHEPTERGTTIFEPCYLCGGSGVRSVRVGPADGEGA